MIVIVEPADTVGDVLDQMRAEEALFVVHVDAPRARQLCRVLPGMLVRSVSRWGQERRDQRGV